MGLKSKLFLCLVFILTSFFINACNKDEAGNPKEDSDLTGVSKEFKIHEVAGSKVSGTITFMEKKNGATLVIMRLEGTTSGSSHPAHIHKGIAAFGKGEIIYDLHSVDGNTGISETEFVSSQVTYEQLINYEGYVNVHKSASEMGKFIAQGDIGKNELSETSKTYTLDSLGANGLKGTAKFTKRMTGMALITLTLTKSLAGAKYPAHIHSNSAAGTGPISFPLIEIDGNTGISMTDIKDITYDQLIDYDGYIDVHKSASEPAIIVSRANIK